MYSVPYNAVSHGLPHQERTSALSWLAYSDLTARLHSLAPNFSQTKEMHFAGERLLDMSSNSTVLNPAPEISSFWANLQQHLTSLKLWFHTRNAKAQLDTIGTLTTLRELVINFPGTGHRAYTDLAEEKLVLKLPHLAKLFLSCLENGELVLLCPKLAEVTFLCTHAMRIDVEHAVLKSLSLINCQQIQFAVRSPEAQLHNLESLDVSSGSELGRHIIQDVAQMQYLQTLTYRDFPAACMPTRFPQSLQSLDLYPDSWCGDPPGGLKELTNQKNLTLFSNWPSQCMAWDFSLPWEEFLPTVSLETVILWSSKYVRHDDGGIASFVRVHEAEFECGSDRQL